LNSHQQSQTTSNRIKVVLDRMRLVGVGRELTHFKHKPRGLGFIGAHVFVGLVDFGVREKIGGLRHVELQKKGAEVEAGVGGV
jgi:hypothetical protein